MGKKRWWGEELRKLETDYLDRTQTLEQVAKKNRTSLGLIASKAKKHGWPPRRYKKNDPRRRALVARRLNLIYRAKKLSDEIALIEHKLKLQDVMRGLNG